MPSTERLSTRETRTQCARRSTRRTVLGLSSLLLCTGAAALLAGCPADLSQITDMFREQPAVADTRSIDRRAARFSAARR